jgi:hypothetical protein
MLRIVTKKMVKRSIVNHLVPPHIMAEKEEKELIEQDKEEPKKHFVVWFGYT